MCSFPILLHFKYAENCCNLRLPERLFPIISTPHEALTSGRISKNNGPCHIEY